MNIYNNKVAIVIVLLLTTLFFVVCVNENDEINLNEYDGIPFKMTNGELISTELYNEFAPSLVKDNEDLYLYFLSDNSELPGHQGASDIYRVKFLPDEKLFDTNIENLNNVISGINDNSQIMGFQAVVYKNELHVFYNQEDSSRVNLYHASSDGITNLTESVSTDIAEIIEQIILINDNIAVLLINKGGSPQIVVVSLSWDTIVYTDSLENLNNKVAGLDIHDFKLINNGESPLIFGLLIHFLENDADKYIWLNPSGNIFNILLPNMPDKSGSLNIGPDGRLYFDGLGLGDTLDLYRFRTTFNIRDNYFDGENSILSENFITGNLGDILNITDSYAPQLIVNNIPAADYYIYSVPFTISGTAIDLLSNIYKVTIQIDEWGEITVDTANNFANWQYNWSPSYGQYEVVITAYDNAGNSTSLFYTITYQDPGQVIFLDPTASTNGVGTKASPYNNLSNALMACTDKELRIKAGTINDQITASDSPLVCTITGAFDSNFQISDPSQYETIISLAETSPVFYVDYDGSDITLKNLSLSYGGTDTAAVYIGSTNTTSIFSFDNCRIYRNPFGEATYNWSVIYVGAGQSVSFNKCEIFITSDTAQINDGYLINIDMYAAGDVSIANSLFYVDTPINVSDGGVNYIYCYASTASPNLDISNNTFYHMTSGNVTQGDVSGIFLSSLDGVIINIDGNNFIKKEGTVLDAVNYLSGITIDATTADIEISRNYFSDFVGGSSVEHLFIGSSNQSTILIHHNLFNINRLLPLVSQTNIYIYYSIPKIYYNTIINNGTNEYNAGIYLYGATEASPELQIAGNIFVHEGTLAGYGVYEGGQFDRPGTFEYNLFNNFSVAYFSFPEVPQELGITGINSMFSTETNIAVDPLLDTDFHLLSGSPAANIGPVATIISSDERKDLELNPRPADNTWDLGCFEDF